MEDYDGDTYRAAYTATLPEVVYVLDVFMKKSKSGVLTPKADKHRVEERFESRQADLMARNTRARTDSGVAGIEAGIEIGGGNVFEDLGPPNAAERLTKAGLARVIRKLVGDRGWTQRRADVK